MKELKFLPLRRIFISNIQQQSRNERNNLYAGMDFYGCLYRTLLQFDLSMLPENTHIASATVKACAAVSSNSASGCFTPYPVVSAWNRRVTWETQPGIDTRITGNTVEINCSGWYTWDITSIVQAWADRSMHNHGLMIKSLEEEEPDLTCFETILSNNPECHSPVLNVTCDNERILPSKHKKTKNSFELCRAADEQTYSAWQKTAGFKIYTYTVQNTGPEEACVRVQISPNQAVYIDEAAEVKLASGETAAIVPQKYAFFTRLSIRAVTPGEGCKLKIWFQAQE